MKSIYFYLLLILLGTSCAKNNSSYQTSAPYSSAKEQKGQVEIMLLGSDHLNQIYEAGNPHTDMFADSRQAEIMEVVGLLQDFNPDMIMVEELPEEQPATDSLFTLFSRNKLALKDIPYGRSEIYQIAFNLGKNMKHSRVYCVNAPGGTSQSVLDNGINIELYKNETINLRKTAKEKYRQIGDGSLSVKDYFIFLNEPSTVQMTHRIRYIIPARVTNGTFKNPDAMIDTAFINPAYIGAELTAVFKNRDYKIYSNIVTTQLRQEAKRIVLVIGQAHVGSLQSIFRDDPEYTLVEANTYLKK